MCEMGAAWVTAGKSIPIIVPPMNFEDIKGVIKDNQGLIINYNENLNSLYETLVEHFNLNRLDTNVWQRKKDKFLESINTKINERNKATRLGVTSDLNFSANVIDNNNSYAGLIANVSRANSNTTYIKGAKTGVLKDVNKITYDKISYDEIALLQLMLANEEEPSDITPAWTIKDGMKDKGLSQLSYSFAIRKLLLVKIIERCAVYDNNNNDNECIGYCITENGNTYIVENGELFLTDIPQSIP